MSDLDQRLAAYARHLDERMSRVDPSATTLAERRVADATEVRNLDTGREPTPPSHRVWLATAAAVVLLVAGSLVWWRNASEDSAGVVDGPDVTVEPAPTGGTEPGHQDCCLDEPAPVVTWRKTDPLAGFATPAAVVGYRGGLLAVSNLAVFKPFSWYAPDGQRWEDQVVMSETGGQPNALATDGSLAVAVGDGDPANRLRGPDEPGTGASWVTADGRTWDRFEVADADTLRSVASTPLGFLAVGSSRTTADGEPREQRVLAAWRSQDGRAWTRVRMPDEAGELTDVAASSDAAVLIGHVDGAPVALVVDRDGGVQSVAVDGVPSPSLDVWPTDVAWDGERFVAAGIAGGQPAGWVLDPDRQVFVRHELGTLPLFSQPVVGVQVAGVRGVDALLLTSATGSEPLTVVAVSAGAEVWTDATPVDGFPVTVSSLTSTGDQFVAISAGGDVFVGELGG